MKAEIYRKEVPAGTVYSEWINATGKWLYLKLPDGTLLTLAPGGRIQVPSADLARVPRIAGWLEGCELKGVLRANDPR